MIGAYYDYATEKQNGHKQNVKLLIAKHYNITSLISKVVTTLIKTGGFVLIALFALQAIRILAGQTTMATIGINFSFLANLKIPEALGVIFGIGVFLMGLPRTYIADRRLSN